MKQQQFLHYITTCKSEKTRFLYIYFFKEKFYLIYMNKNNMYLQNSIHFNNRQLIKIWDFLDLLAVLQKDLGK